MLIVSDPPERNRLKRVLSKAFAPTETARIEGLVGHVVDEVPAEALSAAETDFVGVARLIPNRVVCTVMGIQRSDWDWLGNVTTRGVRGPDEEVRSVAHGEILLYFAELLAERRANPGTDFISLVAHDGHGWGCGTAVTGVGCCTVWRSRG
jgi:cytochrome P450